MEIRTQAYARAGFLGNPSDGYFGKTISISLGNFSANVSLRQTDELEILSHGADLNTFGGIKDLVDRVNLYGYYGGARLIKATIKKFFEYCAQANVQIEDKNFSISFDSSIPRQIGLGGSSAIVTATMRALMQFYDVQIPLEALPSLVLAAELDELGINAGLQDRVIQSYEGCMYMDFNREFMEKNERGIYERVDTSLLPNLYVAYRTKLGKVSGKALGGVRAGFDRGDSTVLECLNRIAQIADEGRQALIQKDSDRLHNLMNENFDLRSKIMNISDGNREMINTARTCGASAKFAGSGGSIIGMYRDQEMFDGLVEAFEKLEAKVIKPEIVEGNS